MEIQLHACMRRLNYLLSDIEQQYHEAAQKLGLSDSAMHILYVLCDKGGGCSLSELYHYGIGKQTVNSSLRKLEGEGILCLEKSSGRNKNVSLTEKGRSLMQETVLRIVVMENEIFDSWQPQDIARYLGYVQKYNEMLKEKIKDL